jgi:iron complex outermembrane receptor protein
VRADANYTDDQYLFATLDPRSLEESYTIVNGRLGLEGPDQRWRVSLWVKNLTKEDYFTLIAPVANGGFFSNGGRAGVSGPLIGINGAPRTYGVEASMKF